MTDAGPPALALDGVSRRFGGVVAVDGVSLTLGAGERVSVIGPNGAGKTTLFRLIAGEMRPSGGRINLLGRDVTRMAAHHRAGLGLARTFQVSNLFVGLTVLENVRLASQTRGRDRWRFWSRMSADDEPGRRSSRGARARRPRRRPRATGSPTCRTASNASSRLRWRSSASRSCCCSTSRRPVSRSPSGDGSAKLLEDLPRTLPVLLIEHDMSLALGLADRVMCMHNGKVIASGTPDDVRRDETVQAVYLGRAVARA